jgi:hypothetical protein
LVLGRTVEEERKVLLVAVLCGCFRLVEFRLSLLRTHWQLSSAEVVSNNHSTFYCHSSLSAYTKKHLKVEIHAYHHILYFVY